MKHPEELLRFITDLSISSSGKVSVNEIDEDNVEDHESEFYQPTYSVSALSRILHHDLKRGRIKGENETLPKDSVTKIVRESTLKEDAKNMYVLTKMCVLESFSIVYHMDEDPSKLRYLSPKDVRRTRENIRYIIDFLGTKEEHRSMIPAFREMDIALGYIEYQIDVIQNTRAVR